MSKISRNIISVFLAVILSIAMSPYMGTQMVQAKTTNTITVGAANTGKVTIPVKARYSLSAKAKTGKLTYKSSKKSVASVTKKGVVKARKPGKAVITIKGKNVTKKIRIKVVKKSKYKKVKKIRFKGAKKTMKAGSKQKLKVTFTPSKASNKNLRFKSSKKSVATVSASGVVKAKKAGKVKITATSCANKKAKKSITITVKKTYTVTFESFGGTEVASQKVIAGGKVKKPADPTLDGADFAGWYQEGEEKAFDFSKAVTANITLLARWDVKDVSSDGTVDPGDLARLEAAGKVQVMSDGETLAPHAIIGPFTEEKVSDTQDAANVLQSLESVFNRTVDENGDIQTTDFDVSADDITEQAVDTPKDEDGIDAPGEVFYKYAPKTADGVQVEGADIILCTDEQGNVTGLNSTYDAAFRTVQRDPDSGLSQDDAEQEAARYMNQLVSDDGSFLLPQTHMIPLYKQTELVIYTATDTVDQFEGKLEQNGNANNGSGANGDGDTNAGNGTNGNTGVDGSGVQGQDTKPFYAYKVHITSEESVPDASDYDPEEDDPPEDEITEGIESDEDAGNGDAADPSGAPAEDLVPVIDWTVYVDAVTGEIRLAYDNFNDVKWHYTTESLSTLSGIYDGNKRDVDIRYAYKDGKKCYEYYNKSRRISVFRMREYMGKDSNGNETYSASHPERTAALMVWNPNSNATANTLLYHGEKVWDYYKKYLGRSSYDNKGSNLFLAYYADYIRGSMNACWSPEYNKIFFTIPKYDRVYTRCLDVMGHEFTHGVAHYVVGTDGFTNSGESGAVSEAYSDIIGNIIEGKLSEGNWNHGEDRATDGSSDPARDLADPDGFYGHSDYYDKYNGTGDNGGVHSNSLIISHAFYLMACDSVTRTQISLSRWAQLFYRSMSRLSPDCKMLDVRYALFAEAKAMGFTERQLYSITKAFDQVHVKAPEPITLTMKWGSTPSDLDIHLIGPTEKSYFHVYFNNKFYWEYNGTLAYLDQDARKANGTEVIKLTNYRDGTYYCFINYHAGGDDKNSTVLSKSKAVLTAHHPDKSGTLYYSVDTDSKGTYWLACKIKIENSFPTFYHYTKYYSDDALCRYGGEDLIKKVYKKYQ